MRQKKLRQQEITSKYNSFAKYYNFAELFMSLLIGRYRKELLRGVKGKVLEVGIGTGANLRYYSDDCEITGVDLSKEMLKMSRFKADKFGRKVKLIMGNAEKLPFKKRGFDFVVDTLCLCTYPNPIKALKEMKRVCKRNGKILLLEHGISDNKFVAKMQGEREERHYQRVGCSLLRDHFELAKKAGLKIIRRERKLFGIIYL